MPLTLRQLAYFVAIVDMGSITRAAERLHVAPTAVSLQVKAMEEFLGVRLLDRHSRGVRPSDSGSDLYARARQILDLVRAAERDLSAAGRAAPLRLRLGAPPAITRVIGAEGIVAAGAWHDGVALQITEGWSSELHERLLRGDLDALIGYSIPRAEGLQLHRLFDERFVFAAAPALAGPEGPIPIARALDSALVFYGERSISWQAANAAAQQVGRRMHVLQEVQSIDVWRSFLCRGLGAAITPLGAIADEVRRGDVVVRRIEDVPVGARMSLAVRVAAATAPLPEGFVDFLIDFVTGRYLRLAEACGEADNGPPLIRPTPRVAGPTGSAVRIAVTRPGG